MYTTYIDPFKPNFHQEDVITVANGVEEEIGTVLQNVGKEQGAQYTIYIQ